MITNTCEQKQTLPLTRLHTSTHICANNSCTQSAQVRREKMNTNTYTHASTHKHRHPHILTEMQTSHATPTQKKKKNTVAVIRNPDQREQKTTGKIYAYLLYSYKEMNSAITFTKNTHKLPKACTRTQAHTHANTYKRKHTLTQKFKNAHTTLQTGPRAHTCTHASAL
jgi:predicted secreted protein